MGGRTLFQQVKIAICEDQKVFINLLSSIIDSKFKKKNISFSLDVFTNGEELLAEALSSSEKYDIIFFDIDLPGIDGTEAARKIRTMDKVCIFIFITSLDEEVYKIFDTGAFDFIRKSYFDKEIEGVLNRLIKKISINLNKLTINTLEEGPMELRIDEILYIQACDKRVFIFTHENSFGTTYRTLKELPMDLTQYHFFQIYRGLLVNLNYVSKIIEHTVLLENNEELPISRRKITEFEKLFYKSA